MRPITEVTLENSISCSIKQNSQAGSGLYLRPWPFGEDASKATCLWLENLQKFTPTKIIEPRLVCCGTYYRKGLENMDVQIAMEKTQQDRDGQTDGGQNKLAPSPDTWRERSRTYTGIGDAWASQWGGGVRAGIESREVCRLERQSYLFDI